MEKKPCKQCNNTGKVEPDGEASKQHAEYVEAMNVAYEWTCTRQDTICTEMPCPDCGGTGWES